MVQGDAALLSVQPSGEGFRHLQAVSKEASIKRSIRARRSKLLVKDWCHWTVRGNELLCGRWLATDRGALIWKNMQNVLFTHMFTQYTPWSFLWLMPNRWIYSGATGRFPWSLSLCVPSTDIPLSPWHGYQAHKMQAMWWSDSRDNEYVIFNLCGSRLKCCDLLKFWLGWTTSDHAAGYSKSNERPDKEEWSTLGVLRESNRSGQLTRIEVKRKSRRI